MDNILSSRPNRTDSNNSTHSNCQTDSTAITEPEAKVINNPKSREVWIDILRGITMLLVVYSHLVSSNSSLNSVFMTTRMPLFFFISGFFIYSLDYDFQLLWKRLKNRLTKQLYPTVILFSLFVIVFENCNFLMVYDDYKAGYWFTYVSVLYFLTLSPLLLLFSTLKLNDWGRILVFSAIILISIITHSVASHANIFASDLSHLLSFEHYISFLRYITCGCIFRILWNKYNNQLMSWILFTLSLAGFIICLRGHNSYISILTGFFGIYIMLFTIYNLTRKINANNRIVIWLSFVGSMTLEIYLIHYFILSTIHQFDFMESLKLHIVNTSWEFPIYICLSIVVAVMCLLIVKLLRHLKIYKYLFAKD